MTKPGNARGRVVLTGGAGNVARALRPELVKGGIDDLVLLDLADPGELRPGERWSRTDITDLEALTAALAGARSVIHLAGFPRDGEFESILAINVVGTSNLYEAARRAGVERVVYGSSNHATGFYPRSATVRPEDPMRPDGLYGLSKCWGELTAGLYFEKCGIRTLAIRIGNAQERPTNPRSLLIWISPRDLAQLVFIGLDHPEIDCHTVWGIGASGTTWYDNSTAERLGYRPQDVPADFAAPGAQEPRASEMPAIEDHFQGAMFCMWGHDGVVRRRQGV
ncbi:NAD-dependent epimerase/dehydratase family protein [Prosthecomicrobium sp. N25]|uniref:NAD-dependent epimerase/dehydratase family protein n=1 Tax=Prosthecomicrobium sp. N25 TaxID=3129254 RepID=UPI003077B53B